MGLYDKVKSLGLHTYGRTNVFLIFNPRETLVNREDLQAQTLAGLTRDPVSDVVDVGRLLVFTQNKNITNCNILLRVKQSILV